MREREIVRSAARQGVPFGFLMDVCDREGLGKPGSEGRSEKEKRMECDAVMLERVREPSCAKDDWCTRSRE